MSFPLLRGALRWFNLHRWWRNGTVPVWGSRLRPPTFDRWLALRLHQAGLMGVGDRSFFERHVRPGMTVVDVGANQGLYTLLFASLTGATGRVYAFEPDDLLYAALLENVTTCNRPVNVALRHAALGAAAGTLTLHRSLLNSGDNRLADRAVDAGPREAVTVRVERLDEALAGERIDFVKVDVQGWEAAVLAGMGDLLDEPRNSRIAIYFEFWPSGLREAGSDPASALKFLADRGFTIYQPQMGELGPPVQDFSRLVRAFWSRGYTNLYARRENVPDRFTSF